jgi:diguanylate cyclase (GGDEF)-like protein
LQIILTRPQDGFATVGFDHKNSLKAWFVPGGVLLLIAIAALEFDFIPISTQTADFYYYAVFGAGILLAWRFHSSRVIFALLTLLLAHRAIEFFSAGQLLASGPGHIAFETVALVLPINFLLFSIAPDRGFAVGALASRLGLLFCESVFVAVICAPGQTSGPGFVRATLLNTHLFEWTKIPQPAALAFVLVLGTLAVRFLLYGKPVENGLLWSLTAAFLGFHAGAIGKLGTSYFATAGLILAAALVENSYFLAYHDELTSLPARRSFNDASLALEPPYAVAVVDIDHFKKVNDTYGHETGDQVLSMVASRLGRVSAGRAYRVGGEEFSILFPGKTAKEVIPDLETLRGLIADSSFRVRAIPERRKISRGADRRGTSSSQKQRIADPSNSGQLSVTISIGVAEGNGKTRAVEDVIKAADQALYRAKRGGRNRVEVAGPSRPGLARRAASR